MFKDVTINGKRVSLYADEFQARRFHKPFNQLMGYERTGDFDKDIAPFVPFVHEWEFDGEPESLEAWGNLDYIKELTPLMIEIGLIWQERLAALGEASGENEEKN